MPLIALLNEKTRAEAVSQAYGFASVALAEGYEFAYVSYRDVDLQRDTVEGQFLSKGSWQRRRVALPAAARARLPSNALPATRRTRAGLAKKIALTSYTTGSKLSQ